MPSQHGDSYRIAEFLDSLHASLNALPMPSVQTKVNTYAVSPTPLINAAVLVPLVVRENRLEIVLTRRTEHLPSHPGQISFPGGRMDADDVTPMDTATRETREEIGVAPEQVRILGTLDELETPSGYRIFPVVGHIAADVRYVMNCSEVAEIFHVPLQFALDRQNHRVITRPIEGRTIQYHEIRFARWTIWGATARMLVNFADKVECSAWFHGLHDVFRDG